MREHFNLIKPISTAELKALETHCLEILQPVLRSSVVEKLNYMVDGMEAVIVYSDAKKYRIEINPIRGE